MKLIFITLLFFFLLSYNNLLAQQWTQTNGPTGGNIVDIEISSVDPQMMYAAGSMGRPVQIDKRR